MSDFLNYAIPKMMEQRRAITDDAQFELLGRLPAPSVPVSTSEEAAASLTPLKLGSLRYKVLLFIISRGDQGATTDEIEASLEGRHQTISPRVNELAEVYKYIRRCNGEDGSDWIQRRTRSGRAAFAYVATEMGRRIVAG